MLRLAPLLVVLAACPSGHGSTPEPDAPVVKPPDAAVAQPDAPPLRGYGEPCTLASQCQSGICIGEGAGSFICSRSCTLDVAQDCKAEQAFCVPLASGGNACFGTIATGFDTDDAVVHTGDSVTRVVTPLGDADLFEVVLDQLGTTTFTVVPDATIDVKLEAYGQLGDAIGAANDHGPGLAEGLQTTVQQVGTHMFLVVRDVGSSTGGYTFRVAHVAGTIAPDLRRVP